MNLDRLTKSYHDFQTLTEGRYHLHNVSKKSDCPYAVGQSICQFYLHWPKKALINSGQEGDWMARPSNCLQ